MVELYQPMTEGMHDIHGAIVQCMSSTLAELKRSNATVSKERHILQFLYFHIYWCSLSLCLCAHHLPSNLSFSLLVDEFSTLLIISTKY